MFEFVVFGRGKRLQQRFQPEQVSKEGPQIHFYYALVLSHLFLGHAQGSTDCYATEGPLWKDVALWCLGSDHCLKQASTGSPAKASTADPKAW